MEQDDRPKALLAEDVPDCLVGELCPPPSRRCLYSSSASFAPVLREIYSSEGIFPALVKNSEHIICSRLGVGFGVSRSFSQLQVGRASAKGRGCRGSR